MFTTNIQQPDCLQYPAMMKLNDNQHLYKERAKQIVIQLESFM